MRADRDDQIGAGLVREQQRRVLTRAFGDESFELHARRFQPFEARGATVGMHVMDEFRAAVQRDRRERIEVTDDDVRRAPVVQQRVRTAVDGDEHGAVLADVRTQRAEIALVVEPTDDNERLPTTDSSS